MKPLRYTLIALAAACGFANAQTTAYTTPVGYVTSYVGPNASGNVSGAATFIAPSLVMPTDYAGSATAAPTGKVITLPEGVPVDLDSTWMLEIADGTQEGWWSAITASTSTSITVLDDFPAGLDANVKVSVRKFTTIQDLFGDNDPGLVNAEIQTIPDPAVLPQVTKTIAWFDGFGWADPVTEEPAGGEIIYPGTAVKVINKDNATLPVVMVGEVKLTKTQVDIFPQFNWLGQPNPTGGTLGSMTFGTQLLTLTDKLDIFLVDSGTAQEVVRYIAFEGVMYDEVEETDASDVEIEAGNGYQIYRPEGGASVITIPAQVVAP